MSTNLLQSIEQFQQSWNILSSTLQTRSNVGLIYQNRMLAGARDIIAFSAIFNTVYRASFTLAQDDMLRTRSMNFSELNSYWALHGDSRTELDHQLASAYKAMLFFIRAYQDTIYAMLLELTGGKAGNYSSMGDCVKKKSNHVYRRLIDKLPSYLEWFERMREQRNRIKNGITTGSGFQMVQGVSKLVINLHIVRMDDNPPTIDIQEGVGIEDIVEAVQNSVALTNFSNEWAEEIWNAHKA